MNITPQKHRQIFGDLSPRQMEIIQDTKSRVIAVAAGPGSGKTRVLVCKLASLLLMEDVKHEQLLMLTFTRAAATEFKKRLRELIGNAANFVEIKTFHSYCFDLLGRMGTLEAAGDAVPAAVRMIEDGEIEPGRIRKAVLVIDEAQDMDEQEYRLIRTLMNQNEVMRVIAVGDDDQNIFSFRGSSSRYLRELGQEPGGRVYEMTENYRSLERVVAVENAFAATMKERMKSEPLRAARTEPGRVMIIRHGSWPFFRAVTEQLRATWRGGSAAVLVSTNEEALRLFTLLRRVGLRADMAQGLDGFPLDRLLEMRVFLNYLDTRLQGGPVISRALWDQAKAHTEKICHGSETLEMCRRLWSDFEETNETRYRSDLTNFIQESRAEDFAEDDRKTIHVSTIHKAKGREFDQVYLALRGSGSVDEEEKRRIYVGLTRAREELYIHCFRGGFALELPKGVEQAEDNRPETEPAEVLLPLGHRDVVLDYFRSREGVTGCLRSGMPLDMAGEYLTARLDGKQVRAAKLSRACLERLRGLMEKGYVFRYGKIRQVVAWKPEDTREDCWIILPELDFEKKGSSQ